MQFVVLFALVACVAAKPGLLHAPLAYTAPAAVLAAPAPIVTATSSQVIARNYNGIASAPIVAPVTKVVAPVAAPVAAAYTAPVAAAYAAPVAAATTFSSHLAYSAPLTYAAAPAAYYL